MLFCHGAARDASVCAIVSVCATLRSACPYVGCAGLAGSEARGSARAPLAREALPAHPGHGRPSDEASLPALATGHHHHHRPLLTSAIPLHSSSMVRLTPSSLRLSALPRTPLARRPISSSAPLRDQASAKASEVGSKAKEAAQQASNKASQAADKVKGAVPSGAGGKSAGEAADKAKGAAKEAGSQLSGYADKLKEMAGPMGKKVQGMLGGE